MEEVDLHRVFFIHGKLDNIDIKSLKEDCLKSFKNSKKVSNDITDVRNEDLKIPKSKAFNNIVSQIQEKFLKKYSQKIKLDDFWAVVHRKNESTHTHDHVDCFDIKNSPDYSAVFYVQVPDNSGVIIFEYPINKYNQTKRWWYPPSEGHYLIFPSTLDHLVTKNNSNDLRIVISFNFKIEKDYK